MEAFRDERAALEERGATVVALSTDSREKLADFRAAIGADFRFVADPKAEIASAYGVKMPLVAVAQRRTFVLDRERRIVKIVSGKDAVEVTSAIEVCPLPGAG